MKLKRSWQLAAGLSGLFVLAGLVLLFVSERLSAPWSTLVAQLGSFLVAAVAVALIFEFWQLRTLLEDLFDKIPSADEWRRSGIRRFSATFNDSVPWAELFYKSDRLNLVVAYAMTWRNTNQEQLERFVRRQGTVLEVVLPDPERQESMEEFGRRFDLPPEEVADRIREAVQFFQELAENAHNESIVRLYLWPRTLQFSFYRFNTRAVFASYRHPHGRGGVITLLAERDGELYSWISKEWDGMTADPGAEARQVYPENDAPGGA